MGLIQTVKQIFATFTETAAPANPDAGDQRLYIDPADHKLKRINSSGTIVTVEGGAGGTTGSTDNAVLRADGTGGSTMQSSLATVDDSGTVNIPTGQTYNINNSPHTHAAGGASITEGAYSAIPGSPTNNDLYLATDSGVLHHRASGVWVPFGPVIAKLTYPLNITGAATTLNNGGTVGIGDVSLVVTSAAGFPVAPFYILIESELILVGAKSGTTFSSLTRGYNGTAAATHADGTAVTLKNWAWANQGTSTLDQTYGPAIVTSQVNGGQTLRVLHTPAPATPYTLTALVERGVPEHFNYLGCGIGFRENSSGKYLFYGPSESDGTFSFEVMRWASTTSYTSAYKNSGVSMGILPRYWLQIQDDGTNLNFKISFSGLPGTWHQFYTNLRGNYFSSGPDGLAMLLYQENGSIQSQGVFWSWVVA